MSGVVVCECPHGALALPDSWPSRVRSGLCAACAEACRRVQLREAALAALLAPLCARVGVPLGDWPRMPEGVPLRLRQYLFELVSLTPAVVAAWSARDVEREAAREAGVLAHGFSWLWLEVLPPDLEDQWATALWCLGGLVASPAPPRCLVSFPMRLALDERVPSWRSGLVVSVEASPVGWDDLVLFEDQVSGDVVSYRFVPAGLDGVQAELYRTFRADGQPLDVALAGARLLT